MEIAPELPYLARDPICPNCYRLTSTPDISQFVSIACIAVLRELHHKVHYES
jgi:hypothetical protein